MRYLFTPLLLFATSLSFAQWSELAYTASDSLNDVYFFSGTDGIAVGNNGLVISTTDGGSNWSTVTIGTSDNLKALHFADANTGWVAGDNGVVFKTTDGGATWTAQTSGTSTDLFDIHFFDSNNGVIVGGELSVVIRKTSDGGTNWVPQIIGTFCNFFYAVFLTGPTAMFIACKIGQINYTFNGGVQWFINNVTPNIALNQIQFLSPDTGFIVGNSGTILHATDSGITWVAQTSGTTTDLKTIFFTSSNIGYAAGDSGTIIYTNDQGTTWSPQDVGGSNININAIHFPDATIGYAVGDDKILKTLVPVINISNPNGGEIWPGETTQNINWTSSNVTNIDLAYSTNGTDWEVIDTSISAASGTYAWSVPDTASMTVLIQISDAMFPGIQDTSDEVFEISKLELTLTAPNGGEVWLSLDTENIQWTSLNVTNIDLEYSVDGSTWTSIAISQDASTGSYAWTVPNDPSTTARVKIINSFYSTNYDESDSDFEIEFMNGISLLAINSIKIKLYPNPNNQYAIIEFENPDAGSVELSLYDMQGRLISQIVDKEFPRSKQSIQFSTADLPPGSYLIQLNTERGEEQIIWQKAR